MDATAAIGEPKQAHKAHNMAVSNNDLSIIACSHHLHMGAILTFTYGCNSLSTSHSREPCIHRHAKRWQQNHKLQNFCTNWIFAGEGSIKADDVSFASIIYITIV